MRPLRVVRLFLLVLALGMISLIYLFIATERGFSSYLPMLINAPIHSGVKMLHTRWKDLTGHREGYCLANHQPNASKHNWLSYTLDSHHLEQVAKGLKLNLKEAWVSPSLSLFSIKDLEKVDIPQFKARIPALVYYKGIFLAFCEARFDGIHDWGTMALSLRRGMLRGREVTWERIRLITAIPNHRTMNPSPIVDRQNDAIVLVFSAFLTHMHFKDMLMHADQPLSKVYVMKSYDVGFTWTDPVEITSSTIGKMHPFPVLYVPGPGHSIQMKCGRLVVPGNFFTFDKTGNGINNICRNCTNLSNIIYSDDGGTTWHLGAETGPTNDASGAPVHPNEAQVAELQDGTLYMNLRTINSFQPRAYCYSYDGGQNLTPVQLHASLPEPGFKKKKRGKNKKKVWKPSGTGGCQGSVISLDINSTIQVPNSHRTWLIFSNPADHRERINLGIRLSADRGKSWSNPWIIFPYKSAYSDLVYFETTTNGKLEQCLAILFEGGSSTFSDHIQFQMFNLEALIQNILDRGTQDR